MEAFNEIYSLIASPNINLVGAIYKLLLSFVLGGVIGLERHHKGQFAGMRTFSLICMGATMAMLVSIYIPQEYLGLKNGDPGRIAAQVVSGVGFLGAGAIIQMKGSVKGLTTAAGIWMTACIGLAAVARLSRLIGNFLIRLLSRHVHHLHGSNVAHHLRALVCRPLCDAIHSCRRKQDYPCEGEWHHGRCGYTS